MKEPAGQAPVWRIVGTLLSLALLVYLVLAQGWDDFAQVLQQIPLQTLLAAAALMLLSRLCVSLRWFALLRSAKMKLSLPQCLRLVFMGLFASNFLPTTIGGDVVRLAGAVLLRLDAALIAASLVVDRLVGMAGMAAALPIGLAAVLGQGASGPLALAAFRLPGARTLLKKGAGFVKKLMTSSTIWLHEPAGLGLALLCTFGHMAFTFLSVWVLLQGMDEALSFWFIGGLWSLSYFITLIPISINGLGLQEVSVAYLYANFGGVSMEAGLALAVCMRVLFMISSLPGALFLPDILKPAAKSTGDHSI